MNFLLLLIRNFMEIFVMKQLKTKYQHFTVKDFNKVYEELFGGFESLGSYDTETDMRVMLK